MDPYGAFVHKPLEDENGFLLQWSQCPTPLCRNSGSLKSSIHQKATRKERESLPPFMWPKVLHKRLLSLCDSTLKKRSRLVSSTSQNTSFATTVVHGHGFNLNLTGLLLENKRLPSWLVPCFSFLVLKD